MNFTELERDMHAWGPQAVISWAISHYSKIAISFSGAEDVVLIDMATRLGADIQIFSLDTGRLHPQTYRYLDVVQQHYGVKIEVLFPDFVQVQMLVKQKGLHSFYYEGHKECCAIRKIEPLRRKLDTLDAWITGQRKDQSIDTRAALAVIEHDRVFSSEARPLVKFNPLANWRSAEVWEYIRQHELPYNSLHEEGYISIGCEPCTRAVLPGQHEREGRWWWESASDKECGLHAGNTKAVAG